MDDTCVMTRNESGVDDAVLDQDPSSPTFGQLIEAPSDTFYDGPCLLKAPTGLTNRPEEQGGRIYTQGEYQIKLPLTFLVENPEAEPRIGDYALMTSSRRDPAAVGHVFRVIDVTYKTMATSRVCSLEHRS